MPFVFFHSTCLLVLDGITHVTFKGVSPHIFSMGAACTLQFSYQLFIARAVVDAVS